VRHDVAVPNNVARKIREYTYVYLVVQDCRPDFLAKWQNGKMAGVSRWLPIRALHGNDCFQYVPDVACDG
jgi:hypothetical protein